MPFTASQVAAITATDKRQRISCGESLLLIVESEKRGGGKSFVGTTRFPPGRKGKQVDVRIGVFGKKDGQFTLKAAHDSWRQIREWSREEGRDPRDWKKKERRELVERQSAPTLQRAVDEYLANSTHRATTKKDYTNCLMNQVLPGLGADTPLQDFTWGRTHLDGRTGRRIVLDWKKSIEKRAPVQSDKALMVLRQVFDYAIDQGWLETPNPALGSKYSKAKHQVEHHPCIEWHELPLFFERLQKNEPNGSFAVVSAVKVLFLTFLRVNSLSGLRWDELDLEKDVWVVPASRMKNRKEFLVPLTDPLKDVLEQLRELNGDQEYAFFTGRSGKYPHMHPSSINSHLIKMGYKGMLVGHGVRQLPMTYGQDILKYSSEVIQRQLSHTVGDKVRQAYDSSTMLDERRDFMIAWSDAMLERGLII